MTFIIKYNYNIKTQDIDDVLVVVAAVIVDDDNSDYHNDDVLTFYDDHDDDNGGGDDGDACGDSYSDDNYVVVGDVGFDCVILMLLLF